MYVTPLHCHHSNVPLFQLKVKYLQLSSIPITTFNGGIDNSEKYDVIWTPLRGWRRGLCSLELTTMILVWVEVAGDDNSVRELPAGERVLGLLALAGRTELDEDLAAAGHLHPGHGTGYLDRPDLAVLGALLADVLQDVLVLLLVYQLIGGYHVQETQHLGALARTSHASHTRYLNGNRAG